MPGILEPAPIDPNARLLQRLKAHEDRLSALERGQSLLPLTTTTPVDAGPDGLTAADSGSARLWIRLNGVWRYVSLT